MSKMCVPNTLMFHRQILFFILLHHKIKKIFLKEQEKVGELDGIE